MNRDPRISVLEERIEELEARLKRYMDAYAEKADMVTRLKMELSLSIDREKALAK